MKVCIYTLIILLLPLNLLSHPLKNRKAPFIALKDGEGRIPYSHEILEKSDLLVLTFFSKDCREEVPVFNEVSRKEKGVSIVWILAGEKEEVAKRIKNEWGIEFTLLADKFSESARDYLTGNMFPQTFFITKDGIIREWKPGKMDRDTLIGIIRRLKR